ncbi:MAG: glycosyltransferase, partial [Rhodanobacteraceae bacterium]
MNAGLVLFHAFAGAVLLFVWLNSLANLFLVRRLRPASEAAADAPFVSLLVPARNEARRIVPCLRSLGAQCYPRFEVVLLDDASEDNTAALAGELGFAATGERRILRGQPLPSGWTGKAWA